jgi:nicotinamide mononucleotide transporter
VLLSYRNIWCWGFGITGSVLGIVIMYDSALYGQVLLHIYYALVGVYGWWHWNKSSARKPNIVIIKPILHVWIILLGTFLSFAFGWYLSNYRQETVAYSDSAITIFAMMASFMQARRWLSSWIYWLIINISSVALYFSQSLYGYTLLMLVYVGMCVVGYISWRKYTK